MPDDLTLDRIELRVRDIDLVSTYYRDVLGLRGDEELSLPGSRFTVALHHEPDAPLRPYPCVGMYHFALLVPDRPALGAIFRHLAARNEPFEGMADHLVSEALYLRDPEGNGIELYRDRPQDEWPYDGDQVQMTSDPLDVDGVAGAADAATTLHPETRFGHIHLHGRNLASAESFFAGTLGLSVTQRTYRGALFFAAGSYHHHVAVNVWAPRGEVPAGATGLVGYRMRVPGASRPEVLTDPVGARVTVVAG